MGPWLAAVVVGLLAQQPSPAVAQSVWELTPYRVEVLLAMGRSPELSPQFEAGLRADLLCRTDTVIGAPWEVTIARAPDKLRRALAAGTLWEKPNAIAMESLPGESLQFDKVALMVVLPMPTGYEVTARQLDVRTQTWSAAVRMTAWQTAKLGDTAFRALCRSFAPLAQIALVDTENDQVTLRLRAAELPARDTDFADVFWKRPGDIYLPVVRYNDREGNVKRISPVPWTYLSVDRANDAGRLECRIHTGLRSPLTGRLRGRVQRLAVGVLAPHAPTRLTLTSRTKPDQVLAGYDIYDQALDSPATRLLGRTDQQGSLLVGPVGPLLRVLLVKHGGSLLAKLPIVPGLVPQIDAAVPDDDQRLEAEGYLLGFQAELIDLVTRRQLLLTQARARLEAGELDKADALAQQLQQLKSRDEFGRELTQEQQKTFADDATVQRQIDSMFANTQKVLQQYLDPKPIEQLTDELAKARSGKT